MTISRRSSLCHSALWYTCGPHAGDLVARVRGTELKEELKLKLQPENGVFEAELNPFFIKLWLGMAPIDSCV